jgi:hypothetical protein
MAAFKKLFFAILYGSRVYQQFVTVGWMHSCKNGTFYYLLFVLEFILGSTVYCIQSILLLLIVQVMIILVAKAEYL